MFVVGYGAKFSSGVRKASFVAGVAGQRGSYWVDPTSGIEAANELKPSYSVPNLCRG